MIRIVFVASGSKGNATLITDGESLIQIDMGVPRKTLAKGTKILGKSVEDIEALFITHDHTDHIGTVSLMPKTTAVYATQCSLNSDEVFETIEPYCGIDVGRLCVFPFSAHHDAPNPVNYLIRVGDEKLGYVTDTGYLDDEALKILQNCDYYLFESNHDLEMLYKSRRPQCLKDRIHSDHGHLSNVDSAIYFSEVLGPRTKAVYLGHISEECNTADIAVSSYRRLLESRNIDPDSIQIVPTKQWDMVLGGDWE